MSHVPTFAFGGIASQPMAYNSFIGGQVYSMDYLLENLEEAGIEHREDAPKKFPTNSILSFTLREVYSKIQKDQPAEFVWSPADYHVPNTRELDMNPIARWKYVAERL